MNPTEGTTDTSKLDENGNTESMEIQELPKIRKLTKAYQNFRKLTQMGRTQIVFTPNMIPFTTDLISYMKQKIDGWTYIHCDFHLHVYDSKVEQFKIRLENNSHYIVIKEYEFLQKLDDFIQESIGDNWKQGLISIHYGFHLYIDPNNTIQRFKFQLEKDGPEVLIEDKIFLQKLDDFSNNRTKLWIE